MDVKGEVLLQLFNTEQKQVKKWDQMFLEPNFFCFSQIQEIKV